MMNELLCPLWYGRKLGVESGFLAEIMFSFRLSFQFQGQSCANCWGKFGSLSIRDIFEENPKCLKTSQVMEHQMSAFSFTWTETTMKLSRVSFLSRGSSFARTFCVNWGENRYLEDNSHCHCYHCYCYCFLDSGIFSLPQIFIKPTPSAAVLVWILPGRWCQSWVIFNIEFWIITQNWI